MSRRRLKLESHMNSEEIKSRYRDCKDSKEARRWHALWLLSQGYSAQQAGEIVGLQSSWVRRILKRFNEQGADGVTDKHLINPGGARPRLNPDQKLELIKALTQAPPDGGFWTGQKVALWIEERTGKKTYPQLGWVYLKEIASVTGVARRKHKLSSNDQGEAD